MTSDVPETDLVRRAREGDEEAFRSLCVRFDATLLERIRRWLSPALRRKVSASDILQEGYLVALRRLGEFEDRGEGSFGRWLARIVELRARALVRRYMGTAKRNALREVSRRRRGDTANFAGRGPTPSQVAMANELGERVRTALGELSASHREVLRLLQEEGITLEEAAVRMNRSLAAVRKLYGRALAGLAERLDIPPRRTT